jgi:hypothetical protein
VSGVGKLRTAVAVPGENGVGGLGADRAGGRAKSSGGGLVGQRLRASGAAGVGGTGTSVTSRSTWGSVVAASVAAVVTVVVPGVAPAAVSNAGIGGVVVALGTANKGRAVAPAAGRKTKEGVAARGEGPAVLGRALPLSASGRGAPIGGGGRKNRNGGRGAAVIGAGAAGTGGVAVVAVAAPAAAGASRRVAVKKSITSPTPMPTRAPTPARRLGKWHVA